MKFADDSPDAHLEATARAITGLAKTCERRAIEAPDSSTNQFWVGLAIGWSAISARVAVLDGHADVRNRGRSQELSDAVVHTIL
jgi:hypothetical protein